MENEHGPCALADDQVALPMTGLGPGVDILGPLVNGDAILDRISRRPRSAGTAALVAAREITLQLLGFLGGPIDEGVDRLDGSQTPSVSFLQPARDLLGVHPSASRSRTKVCKTLSFSIDAACAFGRLRPRKAASGAHWAACCDTAPELRWISLSQRPRRWRR